MIPDSLLLAHRDRQIPAPASPLSSARILVVDDAPKSQDLLAGCLGAAGNRIHAVNDGHEALVQVTAGPPDLILLDLLMCGVDGDEV